ncbi:MAG: zinc-dependent metalloprotease [Propionibacteriaceae bacterium]|nr:zinc-dependent metalloprotease [Propionibacteriaceae bacterium]
MAPNIVAAEVQLEVDPQDFRLWVCLHEETHRVQFTAFPWLRDYLRGQAEALTGLTDQATIAKLDLVKAFTSREGRRGSLLDYLPQSEELRDSIGQVTAVMSLLEGHADVIMDRVGPQVIGSVHQIRERFEIRRNNRSGFDRIVGQLLGMDVKLAQYRDGARFCRHVIDSRGIEMLNLALFSPETLPTLPEIHQPGLWVARMDATVG